MILLAVRKNESLIFECYTVCHLIQSVYKYSVAAVHISSSLKRNTLKLKSAYWFNLCSYILFFIVTQLAVFTLIKFVSHLYLVRFLFRKLHLFYHNLALRSSYAKHYIKKWCYILQFLCEDCYRYVTHQVVWRCVYRPHCTIARAERQPYPLKWVWTETVARIFYLFLYFSLQSTHYTYFLHGVESFFRSSSVNINRVIIKVEVRKGGEAGTIHRWFTGVLLLS